MNTTLPPIIFEDDHLIVVNKPQGMVVNHAATYSGETLQGLLEAYLGISDPLHGIGGRAGIVHRLDKDTSGVLVVAKTQEAFDALQGQFKERLVEKTYWALVHGKPSVGHGIIDAPLGRNPRNRFRFAVVEGGRDAVTEFNVRRSGWHALEMKTRSPQEQTREQVSEVIVHPKTGRTHQIRVHLAALNTPVVGDVIYGGRRRGKTDRVWTERLMLHARSLIVTHPATGLRTTFDAPLPEEVMALLQDVEWENTQYTKLTE